MTVKEATYILKNAAWLGTDEDRETTEAALQMAIAALEKQVGEKPKEYEGIPIKYYKIFRCPSCNKAIITYELEKADPYCQRCGQRIDWTEGV